jgi:hypothetical protein
MTKIERTQLELPATSYKEETSVLRSVVLEERVNHDIALSSGRDEVDRKKRHAPDTTHFLFEKYSLD